MYFGRFEICHRSHERDSQDWSAGELWLAGHNGSRYGTYFTHLNRIEVGDEVKLLDASGEVYQYSVADSFVVGPYDNTIKKQGKETELTLFTCAERGTKRFVVKCEPVE